jgi:hypothetical protein
MNLLVALSVNNSYRRAVIISDCGNAFAQVTLRTDPEPVLPSRQSGVTVRIPSVPDVRDHFTIDRDGPVVGIHHTVAYWLHFGFALQFDIVDNVAKMRTLDNCGSSRQIC